MPHSRYLIGSIPWYSVLIVTGMALAIFLASKKEEKAGFPRDTVVDLCLIMIPVAILCARLYYVAFAWDTYRDHPLSILAIWEGGLAIYGGILGGILTVILFARRRHLSACALLDLLMPGVSLAQSIGRWGNFFNMEAYGLEVTDSRFQFFPLAVQIPEGTGTVWHLATFFYESVWDLIVFLTLSLLIRKRARRHGDVFVWYMLLYAAGRLVIEGLRMDSLMLGSLRVSQLLAALMCLGVPAFFLLRPPRPHADLRALWKTVLLFCLQMLLFAVLPRPAAEQPAAPWLFFALVCLISVPGTMKTLPRLALMLLAWSLYLFLAPLSDTCFSLVYACVSLALSCAAWHTDIVSA